MKADAIGMKTNNSVFLISVAISLSNGVFTESKASGQKFDLKSYTFGYTYGPGPLKWSEDLCKSIDLKALSPSPCKKAQDNIGNKSLRCDSSAKKEKLALYLTLEDCKADLQMATEGNDT